MADFTLHAELRSEVGKNASRRLRREKQIPAVVYGRGTQSVSLTVAEPELQRALKARTSLFDLAVDGESRKVLVKELNLHPVKGTFQHVDFYEVSMDRAVETTTNLYMTGEDEREQDGGILNFVLRQLEISCLPGNIPEYVPVDVSGLVIGDTLHISDLQLPEGVEALTDLTEVVVTVTDPAELEEIEEETDEDLEEPELVGDEDEEADQE